MNFRTVLFRGYITNEREGLHSPSLLHKEVRSLEAINEMTTCVIKVKYSQNDASEFVDVSTVKRATVQRRSVGISTTNWLELRSFLVVTANDLDFTLVDLTAKSHETYDYRIVLNDGTKDYLSQLMRVEADFRGILVATASQGFICLGNPKYTNQREHSIAYVKPYNSKYPHSVKNGASNYNTGTIEGYFNPLNSSCQLEMVYSEYAVALADFLTDGIPKIIKTPDGYLWYAQIDPQVKFDNDSIPGICKASFSWTEIGEAPILTYMGIDSIFDDPIPDTSSISGMIVDEYGNATLRIFEMTVDTKGNAIVS